MGKVEKRQDKIIPLSLASKKKSLVFNRRQKTKNFLFPANDIRKVNPAGNVVGKTPQQIVSNHQKNKGRPIGNKFLKSSHDEGENQQINRKSINRNCRSSRKHKQK